MGTVSRRPGSTGAALAFALVAFWSPPAFAQGVAPVACPDDSGFRRSIEVTSVNIDNSLRLLEFARQRLATNPTEARDEAVRQALACRVNGEDATGRAQQRLPKLVAAGLLCRASASVITDDADVRPSAARTLEQIGNLETGQCAAQRAVALFRRLPSANPEFLRKSLDAHADLTYRLSIVNGQSEKGQRLFTDAVASRKAALDLPGLDVTQRTARILALGDVYRDSGRADRVTGAEAWYNMAPRSPKRAEKFFDLAAGASPGDRRRLLEVARADDPSSVAINVALGKLDFAAGRTAEAGQAFSAAVAQQAPPPGAYPDLAEARYYLSLMAAARNDWPMARTHIDEAGQLGLGPPLRLIRQRCRVTIAMKSEVQKAGASGVSACEQYAQSGPEGAFWGGLYLLRRAQLFARSQNAGQVCNAEGTDVSAGAPGARRCDTQWRENLDQAGSTIQAGNMKLFSLGANQVNAARDPEIDFDAQTLIGNLVAGQRYVTWASQGCPAAGRPDNIPEVFVRFGLGPSCLARD